MRIEGIKVSYRDNKVLHYHMLIGGGDDLELSLKVSFLSYRLGKNTVEFLDKDHRTIVILQEQNSTLNTLQEFKFKLIQSKANAMAEILENTRNNVQDRRFLSDDFLKAEKEFKEDDLLAFLTAQKLIIDKQIKKMYELE